MSKEKEPLQLGSSGDTLREAFGRAMTELAATDERIVVLDADVAGGTGMHHFRKAYPDRFIQCGIAEQNMVAMAGGLAAVGLIPIVTTFAVFALRAVEQARLSIAYAKRNVKIVASHPGLDVGPDGASAQCLEDLAVFRAIPGMTVLSAADPIEAGKAARTIVEFEGPIYLRTGRSPAPTVFGDDHEMKVGKGTQLIDGTDVTIIACGVEVARAVQAANLLREGGISARVINMASIKPVDRELIERAARETGAVVTAEDHNVHGGLGGAVAECLAATYPCPQEFIAVMDTFGKSGEPKELAQHFHLTAPYIADAAKRAIARKEGSK
jgi:transketolase